MRTTVFLSLVGLIGTVSAQPLSLGQALTSALQTRPAVASARLRLHQAKKTRDALGAFPALRLSAGVTDPIAVGGSDEDLVVAQPVDVFGRTAAARRTGDAMIAVSDAQYKATVLDVQSDVVTAYIEASSLSEFLLGAEKIEDLYIRLYEATRKRVDEGVEPGFHLTQVSLDLGQARLRTKLRRGERQAALERLAALIGRPLPVEGLEGIPSLETSPTYPVATLDARPDLLLLSAELQAARADWGLARLVSAPDLEVQARRTPWQESDSRIGYRIQLNVRLFDFGRARSETAAAKAKVEAVEKSLTDARSVAESEWKSARIESTTAKGLVAEHAELVKKARELVERLRPGLTEQATTLIEVLDATRILRDLEQEHVEARTRLASARARLLRASGTLLVTAP